ncbi:21583_t:CDS:2 [Gigaspora margarita]|uniref:21583_t:CDS:1 n=1 Tax=Gigaspora margarita TaxID=4874 RepID=A0ABM8VXP0_GIGMA|nr:21583_t:CDS:2 [Gigaspora margarita]
MSLEWISSVSRLYEQDNWMSNDDSTIELSRISENEPLIRTIYESTLNQCCLLVWRKWLLMGMIYESKLIQ